MNHQDVKMWQDAVMEHSQEVRRIRKDRQLLKGKLEEHLKQFFAFESIEWDAFFDKIVLTFDKDTQPIIRHENIHQLGMDWLIRAEYDDKAFRTVVIEVYPFGLEDGFYPDG